MTRSNKQKATGWIDELKACVNSSDVKGTAALSASVAATTLVPTLGPLAGFAAGIYLLLGGRSGMKKIAIMLEDIHDEVDEIQNELVDLDLTDEVLMARIDYIEEEVLAYLRVGSTEQLKEKVTLAKQLCIANLRAAENRINPEDEHFETELRRWAGPASILEVRCVLDLKCCINFANQNEYAPPLYHESPHKMQARYNLNSRDINRALEMLVRDGLAAHQHQDISKADLESNKSFQYMAVRINPSLLVVDRIGLTMFGQRVQSRLREANLQFD